MVQGVASWAALARGSVSATASSVSMPNTSNRPGAVTARAVANPLHHAGRAGP
jgi:hypothetical protein